MAKPDPVLDVQTLSPAEIQILVGLVEDAIRANTKKRVRLDPLLRKLRHALPVN